MKNSSKIPNQKTEKFDQYHIKIFGKKFQQDPPLAKANIKLTSPTHFHEKIKPKQNYFLTLG